MFGLTVFDICDDAMDGKQAKKKTTVTPLSKPAVTPLIKPATSVSKHAKTDKKKSVWPKGVIPDTMKSEHPYVVEKDGKHWKIGWGDVLPNYVDKIAADEVDLDFGAINIPDGCIRPVQFFRLLMTDSLLEMIVDVTNRRAIEAEASRVFETEKTKNNRPPVPFSHGGWKILNIDELLCFIGIMMLMKYNKRAVRKIWRKDDPVRDLSSHMSRTRYDDINRMLRFYREEDIPLKRGYHRVKRLVEAFNSESRKYWKLGLNNALDDSIWSTKTHSAFYTHRGRKPHPDGMPFDMVVNNQYIWFLELHGTAPATPGLVHYEQVVNRIFPTIPVGRDHMSWFMDRGYTSRIVADAIVERGDFFVGTCLVVQFPLVHAALTDGLVKGQHRFAIREDNKLAAGTYFDRSKPVFIITNAVDCRLTKEVPCKPFFHYNNQEEEEEEEEIELPLDENVSSEKPMQIDKYGQMVLKPKTVVLPQFVNYYRSKYHLVDAADSLFRSIRPESRTYKWTLSIFRAIVTKSYTNAFRLKQSMDSKAVPPIESLLFLDFCKDVSADLVHLYALKNQYFHHPRFTTTVLPSMSVRMMMKDHQIGGCSHGPCLVCWLFRKKKSSTKYFCTTCNCRVHHSRKMGCFDKLHSKEFEDLLQAKRDALYKRPLKEKRDFILQRDSLDDIAINGVPLPKSASAEITSRVMESSGTVKNSPVMKEQDDESDFDGANMENEGLDAILADDKYLEEIYGKFECCIDIPLVPFVSVYHGMVSDEDIEKAILHGIKINADDIDEKINLVLTCIASWWKVHNKWTLYDLWGALLHSEFFDYDCSVAVVGSIDHFVMFQQKKLGENVYELSIVDTMPVLSKYYVKALDRLVADARGAGMTLNYKVTNLGWQCGDKRYLKNTCGILSVINCMTVACHRDFICPTPETVQNYYDSLIQDL
jgi:hypothetical protein